MDRRVLAYIEALKEVVKLHWKDRFMVKEQEKVKATYIEYKEYLKEIE